MRYPIYRILVLCLWITAAREAVASAATVQPYSLSRAAVAQNVSSNLAVIVFNRKLSSAERAALHAAVESEVEKYAPEILPENLTAPSKEIMDLVLSMPMPVEFEDKEYIRARVRLFLFSVPLRINYLETFPPLSQTDKTAIKQSVDSLLQTVQATMERKLIPLNAEGVTKETIDRAVGNFEERLDKQIGINPFVARLSVPLNEKEFGDFLADFAERLRASMPLIQRQVGVGGSIPPENREAIQRVDAIYAQILNPVEAFISDRTSDVRKKNIDVKRFATPGWQAAMNEFQHTMESLRQKSMKSKIKSETSSIERADK